MRRLLLSALCLAAAATAVYAQNADAIKQRREAMRAIAQAGVEPFRMNRNETPFALAPVQNVLRVIQEQGPKFKAAFPADSRTGGTDATAKVWESKAEFDAIIDKWVSDARAAATAITDEASFRAEYPKLTATCGSCHGSRGGYAPGLSDSFRRAQGPL